MKKIALLTFVLLIGLLSGQVQAQSQASSLKNTNWKLYVPDLNDSITLHIQVDSSFASTGTGDVVVRSVCHLSGDTLSLVDYDGQYACPNATGKYKVDLSADANALTLTLIDDPCDGRVNAINKMKWTRAAPPAMK